MKSSREMTEDILGRRDEYVALKRKKIRMFTGSSVTVIGFAVIVTGSMMLINSGVMDQHVPVDTNLSISISEEAPASQVPVKKETERIVNNSSEKKVSVKLSSGVPDNTQPEITPEVPFAAQIVVSVSDTPAVSNKSNDSGNIPSVSTVPSDIAEDPKSAVKESSGSSVKVSLTSKESTVSNKEEVSSSKDPLQTEASATNSESQITESVSAAVITTSESVTVTEPSGSVTDVPVSEVTETVSSSESNVSESEISTAYYVYYDLISDTEKDESVFENMDEVVFENKIYKKVPFSLDYEMSKYMEYIPSNTTVNECEVYYVRKMHMIALVKNKNLALYSLYTEQNNTEE